MAYSIKARSGLIVAGAIIGVAGCAASPTDPSSDVPAIHPAPATMPSINTDITLDEIKPILALPPGKGSSAGQPPLEAVHLYAQAHAAILDRQRPDAIALLEKAAASDPQSFEIQSTLGWLYRKPTTSFDDLSIAALKRAADLEPDHIDLQTELGRQYIGKGNFALALNHFRLALLTRQYKSDLAAASIAEFSLASLLRKEGYERAALEVYQRLVAHLRSPEVEALRSQNVLPLLEHVDVIEVEVADLLARQGQIPAALEAYRKQITRNPGNFELRSLLVHLLLSINRNNDAVLAAEDAAIHFRAHIQSTELLNKAWMAAGGTGGAAGALTELRKTRPNDHAIVYALADALHRDLRDAEAEHVLNDAAAVEPGNFEILQRQFHLVLERGEGIAAARLLVHATWHAPELTTEAADLWASLTRPTVFGRIRWTDLMAMEVPKVEESTRQFWVARLAIAAHRTDVADHALLQALNKTNEARPFAPAYRDQIDRIGDREDLDAKTQFGLTDDVATEAARCFGPGLAEELNAMALLRQGKPKEAAEQFAHAMDEFHLHSPWIVLERAEALRKSGNDSVADSLLWKTVSDHPGLRQAYVDLYLSSLRRQMEGQAQRVVNVWLAAEPEDVSARRIQAIQYQRAGRHDAAEAILLRLFKEHGDDPEAIEGLATFYSAQQQPDRLIKLLQDRHVHEPKNITVSEVLCDTLLAEHRPDDAVRVVDSARAAAGDDGDLLYSIAGFYAKIGRKQTSEDVLRQILKIDPAHPGAANDLGFALADSGRNLTEAEMLIRGAMTAEPHSVAFLDSMAWVLYKRGQYAEARKYINQAIGKPDPTGVKQADPALLDHRGDIYYRLGDKEAAGLDWNRAIESISSSKDNANEEVTHLGTVLAEKSRKLNAGELVPVAPVGDGVSDSPPRTAP